MKPRFTLRAVLVLVTLCAVGLWVWRIGFVERKIFEADVKKIKAAQSQLQVRYLLGPPRMILGKGSRQNWIYDCADQEGAAGVHLQIEFKDGVVERTLLTAYISFPVE